MRFLFPVAGALLALTSALAAACFVKAFGMTFLALPRRRGGGEGARVAGLMLVPQGVLAVICVVLGLAPGWVLEVLRGVAGSLPGVRPAPEMVRGGSLSRPGRGTSTTWRRRLWRWRCWWGWRWRGRCRWGWATR